jgi:hypothetical protein
MGVDAVTGNGVHSTRPLSQQNSGYSTPRGRGRGRGSNWSSSNLRGQPFPRGRGAGRGKYKTSRDAPLSTLLYESRPLLKPVIFVPSVYSKTLFDQVDDILQTTAEDIGLSPILEVIFCGS